MNLVQRFEANSTWEPNSGCRIWLGALKREHGVIKLNGRSESVHRLAWEMERGPIPKALWVLHNCGVGPCFNVAHLRLGTRDENASDRAMHGGYLGKPGGGLLSQVRIADAPRTKRLRATDAELNQAELRRILSYDPSTGIFRWRARPDRDQTWNTRFVGEIAGSVLQIGYRYINLNTKLKTAHRLAWLYMTGEWPIGQVDHINGNRSDNRWINLRAATQIENSANQGIRSTNTSGAKGVSWDAAKGRWKASITVAGKTINIGRYKTLAEAAAARRKAEDEHHGVFAHTQGIA